MSILAGKINVTLIDKNRLFAGKKGKYLDIILIPTPNDKFGNDYMICQSVTVEEKARGIKGAILGNAKILGGKPKEEAPPEEPGEDSQIPF